MSCERRPRCDAAVDRPSTAEREGEREGEKEGDKSHNVGK